jgi:hypothetical protein
MKRKIDPSEYMIDGWDQQGEVRYVRGSRHNKIGMTIMWSYYILFAAMLIRLIVVVNK